MFRWFVTYVTCLGTEIDHLCDIKILIMKTTVNAVINLHKILVSPIVLLLMWHYNNWSSSSFLYLGLHGSYTLLWILKQELYPDKRFEQVLPVWTGFLTPFLPLAAYYVAPFLLISQQTTIPNWVFAAAPAIFTIGIFLHYVGDAQKYYTLRLRQGLITEGLFARTRNPNYLGEIMIYGSFALVSWHLLSLIALTGWTVYFVINMRRKDRSMARHDDFEAYKQKTGQLLPKIYQ